MEEISEDVIGRCQAGDIQALEVIYRAYGDRIYRLCLRLLGEATEAEDAAQEVFLRVYGQISKFSGRSAFSTWLYRVATNHCLNMLKSRQILPSVSALAETAHPCDPAPSPAAEAIKAEERKYLARLLHALDHDDRAIIVLREIEALTYQQIADVLEIPIGTVMSRLRRARGRLRAQVAENFRPIR